MDEEKRETCKETNIEETNKLIVSGNITWKRNGFTSLHEVSSIIGYYTGKYLIFL